MVAFFSGHTTISGATTNTGTSTIHCDIGVREEKP